MKEIHIGRFAQSLALLGFVALVAAGVAAELPEIRRYLKIEAM